MAERFIEGLESRTLLSTNPVFSNEFLENRVDSASLVMPAAVNAPKSYDIMSLSGFNSLGTTRTYSTTYNLTGDLGTFSGSGIEKVIVNKKKVRVNGRDCYNVVSKTPDGSSLTMSWYEDKSGTFIAGTVLFGKDFGKMSLNINDTRISPKEMIVGKSYSDSGDFKGKWTFSLGKDSLSGDVSGNARGTSRLYGIENIVVGGKSYSAVKGFYSLSLNGNITLNIPGEGKVNAKFSATTNQVFWAVPNIGILKSNDTLNEKVTLEGESASISLKTQSILLY